MSECTVTRLRPRGRASYPDSAALNDIHALLTTSSDSSGAVLGDVAAILARTGRPMLRGRDIEATVTDSRIGWPVAGVDAENTTVTVAQDPAGPGLLVNITTRTPDEHGQLVVTLDGRCLYHPCPPGGHAA